MHNVCANTVKKILGMRDYDENSFVPANRGKRITSILRLKALVGSTRKFPAHLNSNQTMIGHCAGEGLSQLRSSRNLITPPLPKN